MLDPISTRAMSDVLVAEMHKQAEGLLDNTSLTARQVVTDLVRACQESFQVCFERGVTILPRRFVWPDGISAVTRTEIPTLGPIQAAEPTAIASTTRPTEAPAASGRRRLSSADALSVDEDPRFDVYRANKSVVALTARCYPDGNANVTNDVINDVKVTIIRRFHADAQNSNISSGIFVREIATRRLFFIPDERTGRLDWVLIGQQHGSKKRTPFLATFVTPMGKEKTGKALNADVDMSLYQFDRTTGYLLRKNAVRDPYTPSCVPIVHTPATFKSPGEVKDVLTCADLKQPLGVSQQSVNQVRHAMLQASVDLTPARKTVVKRTVVPNVGGEKRPGQGSSKKRRTKKLGGKHAFIDSEAEDVDDNEDDEEPSGDGESDGEDAGSEEEEDGNMDEDDEAARA